MGREPQRWTGEFPAILRFLPGQPCCFLHFLELLGKLRTGWGSGTDHQQTLSPLPQGPTESPPPSTSSVALEGNLEAVHVHPRELEDSKGLENDAPVSRVGIRVEGGMFMEVSYITLSHLEIRIPFSSQSGLFQQGAIQVGAVFNT